MKEGTNYYFYQNDHLGTPQKMTAGNGAIVWAAKYTSFLNADVDSSSTNENNLRAPGQYYDAETGLHYNYHRYYDPRTGRYLTPDPIGLAGGINIFVYADCNPIISADSYGLERNDYASWKNYGNYCGPHYCGGKRIKPGEKCDFSVSPTDSMDECCYRHDKCYEKHGISPASPPDECGKNICDKEIQKCLGSLPSNPERWDRPPKVDPKIPKWGYRPGEPMEFDKARKYRHFAKREFGKRVKDSTNWGRK